MKLRVFSMLLMVAFAGGLAGCAASSPSQIVLRPVHRPPHSPEALAHYIDAKISELQGDREAAVRALRAAIVFDSTSATLYGALADNLNLLQRAAEAAVPAERAVRLQPGSSKHRWRLYRALMYGPKDTTRAVQQLEAIAGLDADPIQAYAQMIRIYSTQDRRADVLGMLDRIATLPNLNTRGKLIAAENYRRYDAPDRAEALYREVLAKNPHNLQAWGLLGSSALARGDSLQAARLLRESITYTGGAHPRHTVPIWTQLIDIYTSEPYLKALLAEVPPDTVFLEQMSQAFHEFARSKQQTYPSELLYAKALDLLDRLSELSPTRDDLLAKKGHFLLLENRPADARAAFERAIARNPRAEYWLGVAHTYRLERDREKEIQVLNALYQKVPADASAYSRVVFALGGAYNITGRSAESRAIYRRAAEADPHNPHYRFELGRTYVFEKAWEQAIAVFEKLEGEVTDDSDLLHRVLFELGQCYERGGYFEDATETFQRLLTLDPENDLALNYLGYMLADKGVRLAEAEKLIDRALKSEPQNGAYLDSMGWVCYRQGKLPEAMDYLDKALAIEKKEFGDLKDTLPQLTESQRRNLYENLSVIHDHAGDVAHALGKLAKARKHWERALEFDPENASIREKLQALINTVGDVSR